MKIERLLAITILLLNRRKVLAQDLADRFEVSVRTIYRDIQTLNSAGIPVVSYQGYEGGFCIPDNYKLSRQLLTYDDMLSILTTLKGVNRTLKNEDVERSIEKITALIPEEKEELFRTHTDSFILDISSWGGGERYKKTIQDVHFAVSESKTLSFRYTKANNQKSERVIEPHTLIYKSFVWYVLGYCRVREDFRLFRLSRIRNLDMLQECFVRREFDPKICLDQGQDSRPLVELVLKFKPSMRVRAEEHFEESQLNLDEYGNVIATFSIPDDEWVLSYVLSLGSDVELLSPIHLRAKLHEICKKITKQYC